jgi:glycosyltransferase involved in cell wall biosynthesis
VKPELVFFSHNTVGGVQSYIYNLLLQDTDNRFAKQWILMDDEFNNNPRPQKPFDTGYENIFHYRSDVPVFHIIRQLQQLVSNKPGMVLASFPLELATLHTYRRKQKTIGFICHDEYFLTFARTYDFLIDVFIAHNPHFVTALKELLPHRSKDVYYLPYGITLQNNLNNLNTTAPLRLLVLARMQQSKGVLDIPALVQELQQRNIPFTLTMAGDGPERAKLETVLGEVPGIRFEQPAGSKELMELISEHDVFLLPSYLDGMPVSLMETMTTGLVPVISDFNPGIGETVTQERGYVLPKGDMAAFADVIAVLSNDRALLAEKRDAVLKYARVQFNGAERAKDYYHFFADYKLLKKPTRTKYIRYGRLIDHPKMPRFIHKNYYRFMQLKNKLLKA